MDLNDFIGYPKDEVLNYLIDNKFNYEVIELEDNKFYDAELLVKFEKTNDKFILYFDKFKLNI